MAIELLSDEAISQALATMPDWTRDGDRIRADFEFPNFVAAFAFMTEVADTAERLNHHPEWSNVYNRVEVELVTHDAGGLTALDFELASLMNRCAD